MSMWQSLLVVSEISLIIEWGQCNLFSFSRVNYLLVRLYVPLSYYNWCGPCLIQNFFIVFMSQDVLYNAPLNAFGLLHDPINGLAAVHFRSQGNKLLHALAVEFVFKLANYLKE